MALFTDYTKEQFEALVNSFTTEQLNVVTRNAEDQAIINPQIFAAQVWIGWKKEQLASHYEIPAAAVGQVLTQLGLTLRKFKKKAFVIEGFAPVSETVAATEVAKEAVVIADEVEELEQPVEEESETTPDSYTEVNETTENNPFKVDETQAVVEETQENLSQPVDNPWAN